MQTIETYFIPATNFKGSRIKAKSSGGLAITLGWADELNTNENHDKAARTLINKFGWNDRAWFCGGLKHGGNVYVCTTPYDALTFTDAQAEWVEKSPSTRRGTVE